MTDNVDTAREDDSSSQASISRGSSIHGPYRQEKPDNTFPRCHLVNSITGAEETYSRSLFSSGNGFALWDVTSSHLRGGSRLEEADAVSLEGLSIGDVGTLDPQGQFVFAFNIFTPAADPLHRGSVPEGFETLQPPLDTAEVKTLPDYFEPGSIIASKGVNVNKTSEDPLKLSMYSTVREGAILVLPQGGSREDLISTSRLTDYINKHALDWYQHLRQHSKSGAKVIPNGSLYLITGCDKAKSWSAVAFPSEWRDAGQRVEMTYEEGEFPRWLPSRWAREKGLGRNEGKNRNYCIFVRGIHISLSDRLWARHLPVSPFGIVSYYNILSSSVIGFRSRIARFKERFVRNPDTIWSGYQKFPFHPSILISQLLLEQQPRADIAIVEDSIWLGLAKDGHGTLPEVLDWIVQAFMRGELVKLDKLVKLVPKVSEGDPSKSLGFFQDLLAKYADWRARNRILRQARRIMRST